MTTPVTQRTTLSHFVSISLTLKQVNEVELKTNNIHEVHFRPQPIIRISKMMELLDCSRTTLYRWVKQGVFPQPIMREGRTIGWKLSDYEGWQQSS